MYMQRPNCLVNNREGMHTLQASQSIQALQADRPWTDTIDDGLYHTANSQGASRRPFLSHRQYSRPDQRRPLQRLDEIYGEYEEQTDDDYTPNGYERIDDYVADTSQNRRAMHRLPINNNAVPMAHDANPDMSMCPPCSCPGDAGSGLRSQARPHTQRRRYRRKN